MHAHYSPSADTAKRRSRLCPGEVVRLVPRAPVFPSTRERRQGDVLLQPILCRPIRICKLAQEGARIGGERFSAPKFPVNRASLS